MKHSTGSSFGHRSVPLYSWRFMVSIIIVLMTTWSHSNTRVVVTAYDWSKLWSSSSSSSTKLEKPNDISATINNKVFPIRNREIFTSVTTDDGMIDAPSNLFGEAYIYHFVESHPHSADDTTTTAQIYLEHLWDVIMESSSPDQQPHDTTTTWMTFAQWANAPVAATGLSLLLKYALALRAARPYCLIWKELAESHGIQGSGGVLYTTTTTSALEPTHRFTSMQELEQFLQTPQAFRMMITTNNENTTMDLSEIVLPDEPVWTWNREKNDPSSSSSSSITPVLVLYGDFSDREFIQYMQRLRTFWTTMEHNNNVDDKELSLPTGLRVIVRHVAKASTLISQHHPTYLQGYGVALDIRNVEYKVFDDVDSGNDDESKEERYMEWNENITTTLPDDEFLAGVRIAKWKKDAKSKNETMFGLWKRHDDLNRYAQIVPPNWQRRRLSLQAATVIADKSCGDPLWELVEISQNLPSLAGTLVHVQVPESIARAGAATASSHSGSIYLNQGRRTIHGDRPSFNVFEYLEILKSEQRTLDSIQRRFQNFFPHNKTMGLYQIQQAWMQGSRFWETSNAGGDDVAPSEAGSSSSEYRIDVGRGWKQAVIYLNDVESDLQYAQWTRSVRQMLMSSLQFGMPPSVRRNLFTILTVVDLETCDGNHNGGLQLGWQLVQNSYPARIGILMVSEKDVQSCTQWLAQNTNSNDPCPSPPLFHDIVPKTIQDLKTIPASPHAVHRLMTRFAQEYDDHQQPGALLAYVEYLFSYMHQQRDPASSLTMHDLVSIHGNLMEGMRLSSCDEGQQEAFDFLLQNEDAGGPFVYGKALRFALDKGLKPGMSFLNGRPLPKEDDTSTINAIFTQEQNHIFGMIMRGKITDTTPKSIYAKLLTGNRVFPRNHPLLWGNANDENGKKTHSDYFNDVVLYDGSAYLRADSFSSDAMAHFVVDTFLEFDTEYGRNLAAKLFSGIAEEAIPSSLESSTSVSGEGEITSDKISIASVYRVFPASKSAAEHALCPILAHASLFGASKLKELMMWLSNRNDQNDSPLDVETLLDELNATDDVRGKVSSSISAKNGYCARKATGSSNQLAGNTIFANGRRYNIEENSSLGEGDLELLFSLELERAKAVTGLLRQQNITFQSPCECEKVARIAAFLALEAVSSGSSRDGGRAALHNTMEQIESFHMEDGKNEKYPLLFSWNQPTFSKDDNPRVEVTAVIDPTTEAAQRLSPLLLAIRDQLKLPLQLILTPSPVLENDAKVPITTYYRLVADPKALSTENNEPPRAVFSNLPVNHVLTLKLDVPESWNVQQTHAVQDTDNLRCDVRSGCGDEAYGNKEEFKKIPLHQQKHATYVEYGLKNLLVFGQCYETTKSSPPNGLQLTLSSALFSKNQNSPPRQQQNIVEIGADGSLTTDEYSLQENVNDVSSSVSPPTSSIYSDTLVMKNVGYWQLRANAGVWDLSIAKDSRGAEIFEMVDGSVKHGRIVVRDGSSQQRSSKKRIVLKDYVNQGELLLVRRRPGYETASLFHDDEANVTSDEKKKKGEEEEVINVFSLATGHLYERFLKIMMLSVTKRTSSKVKFWFFENFLSPTFKSSARAMADRIGCEVEFVTYKWPEWLRGQSEKQRIIWGYKILFLDVLFPLHVKKIIYVDADQVVRGDLKELWDMDLHGAPYGYTPMCSSRATTLGYQFWNTGFWKTHLQGKPYHISALYVVDLDRFRRNLVGDQLRSIYQQLSADPNSLANLDQDLPNYAQHQIPIYSLPQEWLWCESWCSDETKALAKTIDLCNNPLHKEPKVSMAKRIISGPLFNESWIELDAEVERYEQEFVRAESS